MMISYLSIVAISCLLFIEEISRSPGDIVLLSLDGCQLLLALIAILAISRSDRRPDVFYDGKVVERQNTRSFWHRYTFSWSTDLLDIAATKLMAISDLPSMDSSIRAKSQSAKYHASPLKPTVRLWKLVFWQVRVTVILQWILVALSCFVDVFPQFAMLQLLRFLESREGSEIIDPRAWLYVGGIFLATCSTTFSDHLIGWFVSSKLVSPLRSMMTSIIYEKMMRMKVIETPQTKSKEHGPQGTAVRNSVADQATTIAASAEKKEDDKTKQQIVNLFAVDANQVAAFAAQSRLYINFLSTVLITFSFLASLIGWKSLLTGLASVVIMVPFNKAMAKRYTAYQQALMKARDRKMAILTEVLKSFIC
jgi:hypothetical protein